MNDLGNWTARAFQEFGWYGGIMLWQYRSDPNGIAIAAATSNLVLAYNNAGLKVGAIKNITPPKQKTSVP
jgi:hypothetical protein